MWSQSEIQQQNLLLGDIHYKIIKSAKLYTLTKPFPALSTSQSVPNCDNQNGYKTLNGIQTENCLSGNGWEYNSGEWFGLNSVCMKSNIWLKSSDLEQDDVDSRCLKYACGNGKLTIKVGDEDEVICESDD